MVNEYPEKSDRPRVLECQKCGAPAPLDDIKRDDDLSHVGRTVHNYQVTVSRGVPLDSTGRQYFGVPAVDSLFGMPVHLIREYADLREGMERSAFLMEHFGRNGIEQADILDAGAKYLSENSPDPFNGGTWLMGEVARQSAESLDDKIVKEYKSKHKR